MAEYHFPVPGSLKEKEIVVFVRRHWISFLGQFLLSILLLAIPIIIFIVVAVLGAWQIFQGVVANFAVLIFSAYYLVVITFAFVSWISFYYDVYIVTRTEIIEITQVGFFGRAISQLPLLRVQDVTSSIKGFLPTLFAYGDVLVETASEQKEPVVLCSVPNPQEIASKIVELHDQVVEVEGRHDQLLEGEGLLAPGRIVDKNSSPDKEKPNVSASEQPDKTQYQELLEKDKSLREEEETSPTKENLQPKAGPPWAEKEGEISQDDLDKGGEIDLK